MEILEINCKASMTAMYGVEMIEKSSGQELKSLLGLEDTSSDWAG